MSSRMYDSYCSLTCKMILAVLRTLALHQTLFCIAENAPCIFFTGYPEQERDVIVRNALCTVFCAYFSALGILGNAPDTLRNTFLGYVASDSLVTLRKPQFNTWENWLHHGMTGLLLGYTALDPSRDYELFQLAGVGEISTFSFALPTPFATSPPFANGSRVGTSGRGLPLPSVSLWCGSGGGHTCYWYKRNRHRTWRWLPRIMGSWGCNTIGEGCCCGKFENCYGRHKKKVILLC